MDSVFYWCGFLGSWLLVGGPLFQAAMELGNEEFERRRIDEVAKTLDRPEPLSRWWWLFPPARYWKQHQRHDAWQHDVFDHLSATEQRQLVSYINTGSGWVFVGIGGFLIAIKETWELVEHYEWPIAVFVGLIVLMLTICISNTAYRTEQSAKMLAGQSD